MQPSLSNAKQPFFCHWKRSPFPRSELLQRHRTEAPSCSGKQRLSARVRGNARTALQPAALLARCRSGGEAAPRPQLSSSAPRPRGREASGRQAAPTATPLPGPASRLPHRSRTGRRRRQRSDASIPEPTCGAGLQPRRAAAVSLASRGRAPLLGPAGGPGERSVSALGTLPGRSRAGGEEPRGGCGWAGSAHGCAVVCGAAQPGARDRACGRGSKCACVRAPVCARACTHLHPQSHRGWKGPPEIVESNPLPQHVP